MPDQPPPCAVGRQVTRTDRLGGLDWGETCPQPATNRHAVRVPDFGDIGFCDAHGGALGPHLAEQRAKRLAAQGIDSSATCAVGRLVTRDPQPGHTVDWASPCSNPPEIPIADRGQRFMLCIPHARAIASPRT